MKERIWERPEEGTRAVGSILVVRDEETRSVVDAGTSRRGLVVSSGILSVSTLFTCHKFMAHLRLEECCSRSPLPLRSPSWS